MEPEYSRAANGKGDASTWVRAGDPGKRTGTARGDLLPGVHLKLQQLLESETPTSSKAKTWPCEM